MPKIKTLVKTTIKLLVSSFIGVIKLIVFTGFIVIGGAITGLLARLFVYGFRAAYFW